MSQFTEATLTSALSNYQHWKNSQLRHSPSNHHAIGAINQGCTMADRTVRRRIVCISLSLAQNFKHAGAAYLSEIETTPMCTGFRWARLGASLAVDQLLAEIFGSRSGMWAHLARVRTPASAAAPQRPASNSAQVKQYWRRLKSTESSVHRTGSGQIPMRCPAPR